MCERQITVPNNSILYCSERYVLSGFLLYIDTLDSPLTQSCPGDMIQIYNNHQINTS